MTCIRIVVLVSVLSTGVGVAQTPAVCPWFSTGSAATVLGGQVVLNVNVVGTRQGACRFTRESGGEKQALEISVGKDDSHPCPQGSAKLIAIGNEAMQCKNTDAQGKLLEVIAGRVRNAYFVVSLESGRTDATVPAVPARRAGSGDPPMIERAAEQVAGNLY